MSRLRRGSMVFFTVILAMSLLPVSAQDAGPFPDLAELTGLRAGVSRSASLDFSAFEMEPAGSLEGDEPAYRDILNLTGFVFEFDTSENAAAGYDTFLGHGVEPLVTILGFDNPVLAEGEIEALGDQAHAYSIFNETASTKGYFRYVAMQQDAYVFVAIIITETEEPSLDADALLTAFAEEAGEGHSGLGEHNPEGGSTGGLWDFFSAADDVLYAGLVSDGDEVLFPAQH
ncbi:MAG: hypothetical protein M3457_22850 [Chloroflexota bacterium]|nr:hypothetical protein [Chloroflexota bacterium]